MTDREKAIVMAYTGICMLTGKKFQIFHEYIEDIMGRPIMTHDIGRLEDEIKEKAKADFIALCAEQEPKSIQEKQAESEKYQKAFDDGYANGYSQARLDYEPKIDTFDKIKAEIKEWYWQVDKQALAKDPCVIDAMIDLFIRTIDKYKAESEK